MSAQPWRVRLRNRRGWEDAAGYTISDLTMLRKELLLGFLVAGFLTVLVPAQVWQSLFLTGHGLLSSIENVLLGPLLAILSFVCSVGNVPLAAALWAGHISFGGVVSFVFADLITLPLLAIYRKYYGTAVTLRLLAVLWGVMSVAGLAVEYLFRAVGISAPVPADAAAEMHFQWHTTVLNVLALIGLALLYRLHRRRDTDGGRYARDPVCGMQVEIALAPAGATVDGERYWFCSDHCRERFVAAGPGRPTGDHGSAAAPQQATSPEAGCCHGSASVAAAAPALVAAGEHAAGAGTSASVAHPPGSGSDIVGAATAAATPGADTAAPGHHGCH